MKAIITGIIFFSLFIIGLCDCKQSHDLSIGKDTIPSQEISIKCTQSKGGNYIIRNEQEYHDQLQIRSQHPYCGSYSLPTIDFNQFTLLGVVTDAGGCEPPQVKHYAIKSNQNNGYKFFLIINHQGPCMKSYSVYVWCLVPKINNDIKVDFQIENN